MASENNFEKILEEIKKSSGKISESNYTDVDALIFAELSGINIDALKVPNTYLYDIEGEGAKFDQRFEEYTPAELVHRYEIAYQGKETELKKNDKYQLLKALALSERYKDIKLSNFAHITNQPYTDEFGDQYPVNFKAVTVDLGDTKVIAYAGTGNVIFGWTEDGRMAGAEQGIGAQVWGKEYAEFVINMDSDNIMFAGYSKGGNQAVYAAVNLWDAYSERIKKVINVDGPGFSDKALQTYIGERTFYEIWEGMCEQGIIDATTTPYESFVGHLMNDHLEYNYIEGSSWLLFTNHDYKNWTVEVIDGQPVFKREENANEMAEVSQALEQLVNGLLEHVSPAEMTGAMYVLEKYCLYVGIGTVDGATVEYINDEGIADVEYSLISYFADVPPEQILKTLVEFYNSDVLTEEEKLAFEHLIDGLLADDNLENFLIAWCKQLESTDQADALELAQTLKKIEPFYPAITGMIQTVDVSELILAVGVINGFIESVGGFEALENMSNTEMVLAFINYYDKLPPEEQEKVRALLVDVFEMLEGTFENTSLSEKGEIVNIIGGTAIDGLEGYAKNHPFIVAIGLLVIAVIVSNPIGQWCVRVAAAIMAVLVAVAVIAALWLEFKDDLYNAYIYVRDQVVDFRERMAELIESAINKLKNLVQNIIEYIKNKVTEVKEAGKYIVKEQIVEFSTVWSAAIPSPGLRLSAIITYALKSAYTSANIHVEYDLVKLGRLAERLVSAASSARTLENELENFYWYLKNTKVKISEKKEITLAKKYGIGKRDLSPDKAGTLGSAGRRLSGAYSKLNSLDGTLLA